MPPPATRPAFALPLAALPPFPAAESGEKAARLGRALGEGFPVPDGFVVTAAAFRAWLDAPCGGRPLGTAIRERLEQPDAREPGRVPALALDVRALIDSVPIPDAVATEVTAAYRKLGLGPVAVRSSAPGEDGGRRSLAGHFDSFLDCSGEAAVVDRLRRCFASAWSERCLAAGMRSRSGPEEVQVQAQDMAVLVQRMVRGGPGGVLFTRDPVAGLERMVVEWSAGGAERVAGGEETPLRLVLDRASGRPVGEPGEAGAIAEVEQACSTSDRGSGPSRAASGSPGGLRLPGTERSRLLLSMSDLGPELARLGRRLEDLFGGPQDVEWARDAEGRLWLLQTRPVTGAKRERDIWTAANSQEAIEDPVTPLTYTYLAPWVERGRAKVFAALGVPDPTGGYMRLFYGRIYFNVNYFRRFLESIPGLPPDIFDLLLFGRSGEVTFPRIGLRLLPKALKVLTLVVRTWRHALDRMEAFVRHLSARLAALRHRDLGRLDDAALLAHLDEVGKLAEEAMNLHVLGSAMAGGHYLLLQKFLRGTGVLPGENAVDELLAGAPGIETARSNAAIYDLALLAARLPAVRDCFLREPPDLALARAGGVPGGGEFLAAWERFLDEFGHRAAKEAELARPRWREDPSFCARAIRLWLERGIGTPEAARAGLRRPDDVAQELVERSRGTARRIERALAGRLFGFERILFKHLLRWTEESAPWRENLRFHSLKPLESVRRVFLELGRRLEERRALERADDVFFLEADEALAALRSCGGGAPLPVAWAPPRNEDPAPATALRAEQVRTSPARFHPGPGGALPARARARREAHERALEGPPPPKLLHDDGSEAAPPTAVAAAIAAAGGEGGIDPATGRRFIAGVPVSSGVVTGRVRFVETLDDGWKLEEGEILLARAATPSWTPLFFFATGVILDIGGMLSHAAVIAREYGIPCVVGLETATAELKTGDEVTLDANVGRVYLPARPGASTASP